MLTLWNDFGLGRWNRFGFRDFDRTFSLLDTLMRDAHRRPRGGWGWRALPSGWPRMTSTDAGDAYQVTVELPGVDEKDLSITVQEGTLTISGKRTVETPEGYTAHRRERGHLEFTRTASLPANVDAEGVKATLEDGVLELSLPKAPEAQPRQIPIEAS